MSESQWLLKPEKKKNAKLKLFCFSYAGGNGSTFISLNDRLPEEVELNVVQLPGHGARFSETLHSDMDDLVAGMLVEFKKELNCPYVLFGHSLGSMIATELMYQCHKAGFSLPQYFIASGCRSPKLKSRKGAIHELPDEAFKSVLKKLNGTPDLLLENPDLMDLFLPLLRADFKLSNDYQFKHEHRFNCKASIFGGQDDIDVGLDDLNAWQQMFSLKAKIELFPGDHFFIESVKSMVWDQVIKLINESLLELNKSNLGRNYAEDKGSKILCSESSVAANRPDMVY
ncbi:alpha/beta fold hydrolase [Aliiglaciecola sp. LCG003]|uniref:thioesterase II family protein n=1 Tax=Aliiglaciecola sp. LCG003 TaxID=3053655 RepID=UPI002572C5B4|nr:alpha/beta fold hydrolase [Aliiglaciecola sp. LCG003]WJG11197.1 alpha/beta fold hydrolase [Aliiglaciecola sp. LCG003]